MTKPTATPTPTPAHAKPEPKPQIHLTAVYGRMVNPFLPLVFDTNTTTTVEVIDSWTQSQVDEGKLQVI